MSGTARTAIARGLGRGLRVAGRGGTSLPGKLLLRVDPDAITRLARPLPRGSAVISATNGKTTTTALAAAILDSAGVATLHNVAGANMAGGIASALLERRRGAQLGLFEVDEFWLDTVAGALDPEAIVLSNLFRDQLDRYGELETIADRWSALTARLRARLILNADDPLIADLGRERDGAMFFGIEDSAAAAGTAPSHASDSTHCRRCGTAFHYERSYIAHLGVYACPG
ncbi:MAG TPA: Mur ligase family protein, partial [Solirubrobacteraceae bacterium]|nr:Mur ligase family protein [Solirubrobacteraceae bacterium]